MDRKDLGYRCMDPRGFKILTSVMAHIAHDFSNLLTPLLTYPSLVRNDLPDKCSGHDLLDMIEKTANDMAHVTRQLQFLAAHDEGDRRVLDLNAVVREVGIELQRSSESPGVVVEMALAADLPPVHAIVDDLTAAVENVGRNAVEAAAPRGHVMLRTALVDLLEGTDVSGAPSPAGAFLSLAVRDDGAGIAEGLEGSIFEPFVTTKRMKSKRGSGLGLTIVHKIMREHAGRIGVVSIPGQGTTVTLYLRALSRD